MDLFLENHIDLDSLISLFVRGLVEVGFMMGHGQILIFKSCLMCYALQHSEYLLSIPMVIAQSRLK